MRTKTLVFILVALLQVLSAKAQTTCHFVVESGEWEVSANWLGGIMPGPDDIAYIDSSCYISTNNVVVKKLIVGHEAVFIIMPLGGGIVVTGNISNYGILSVSTYSWSGGKDGALISATLSGTGLYSLRRYFYPSRYSLISSPVPNATASIFSHLYDGMILLNAYLLPYNEATNAYGDFIVNPATSLPVGQGFLAKIESSGPTCVDFDGMFNNGPIGPLNLSLTGSPSDTTGWNLIGNPYPSPIDWNAANGWTKNNVGSTIYIWNNSQYASWNGSAGVNGGSRYITVAQGFFVQAIASGASISMDNRVRTVTPTLFLKESKNEIHYITLSVSGNNYSDEHKIAIKDNASATFDNQFDAYKRYGIPEAPQLYTYKGTAKTSINSVDSLSKLLGKDIYLEVGKDTVYTLSYTYDSTLINLPRILDKQTQNIINPNTQYTFTETPQDNKDRFVFITSVASGINNGNNKLSEVLLYEINNILNVFTDENLISVNLYSLQGTLVLQGNSKTTDLNTLSKGIYMVRVITDKQMKTKKILIK